MNDDNWLRTVGGNPRSREGELVPEHMRIEDIEAWFRTRSLRESEVYSTLDQQEDVERFTKFQNYENKMMENLFAEVDAEETKRREARERQLEDLKRGTIVFQTNEGDTSILPLYPFAASCDAVFALAKSWVYSYSEEKQVIFNLTDYSLESTEMFVRCVLGTKTLDELDPDCIVDCCCIADYLQNRELRDATEHMLKKSIDTSNCLSICQLADHLGMPHLFELSLQHMMQTLGTTDEGTDCWEEMTPDLRQRILVIKSAIQSSLHSQRTKLYFHSLQEYISIFAEKVQYHRERLSEAKAQLELLTPGSHLWMDTQQKIEKQEQRVKTLAAALAEQKKLFGDSSKRKHILPRHGNRNRET